MVAIKRIVKTQTINQNEGQTGNIWSIGLARFPRIVRMSVANERKITSVPQYICATFTILRTNHPDKNFWLVSICNKEAEVGARNQTSGFADLESLFSSPAR